MKRMRNMTVILTGLAMCAGSTVYAEDVALTPGVTVAADENSPTGYTVTFVYEDGGAQSVDLVGTFAFYKEGEPVGRLPEEYIKAVDWVPGDFRASSSDFACSEQMEKVDGTDYWTISLPLPSGHYLYNYNVDGAEENIPDPANQPMCSTAESGNASILSTLNVPYDEKQGNSIDFSFMMPQEGVPEGKVTFADYEDVNGNQAPLAIYLPAGYDPEREEGYKTLYLSHGAGGNEMEWFASGNSQYVFDNMIAAGMVEPTILVTMNNTAYEWDFDVIHENVMEHIIPFMEENYNVDTTAAGRAFAGLSMGGMTTSNMYYKSPDQFGYFGILSGCDSSVDLSTLDQEALKSPVLMLGTGCYDFGADASFGMDGFAVQYLTSQLAALEIDYDLYEVKGGHDWTVWPQLIKIFAERYLWK